jgi:hypothetical protein
MGKAGEVMSQYGLGRKPSPVDSRDWSAEKLMGMVERGEAVPVAWECPVNLNQSQTNHCCGFAAAGYKAAAQAGAPADPSITNDEGHRLYYLMKDTVDQDGPANREEGSYIRSVAKVLRAEGIIDGYAFGGFDVANSWVQKYSPVILGINWYRSMFSPDSRGVITVSGDIAGGHAILWRGDEQAPANNMLHNSWGASWGKNGCAYISDSDLKRLISEHGEACMAVKFVSRKPWSDWPDEQLEAAKFIKDSGVMQGFPDGSFHPYDKLTYRHVALIANRVGLTAPREWLETYAPCTRAVVRDTFPGFTWLEERWDEQITRYQLALLLYRYLKEKA